MKEGTRQWWYPLEVLLSWTGAWEPEGKAEKPGAEGPISCSPSLGSLSTSPTYGDSRTFVTETVEVSPLTKCLAAFKIAYVRSFMWQDLLIKYPSTFEMGEARFPATHIAASLSPFSASCVRSTLRGRQHNNWLQTEIKIYNIPVILFLSRYMFRAIKIIIRWVLWITCVVTQRYMYFIKSPDDDLNRSKHVARWK